MPLVSVPVVTYNSAKTVIETLESIKAQTYPNIELIISDDCSTDNTVALCRDWVEKNKERFVRTEILTVEKNTGVSGNSNRSKEACRAEWIKGIAGDDLLMPNCVQDCMDYVAKHPDTIYLFGRCEAFGADKERCKEIDVWFDYSFFDMSQEQQLHRLIVEGNCIPASTAFYNRVRFMQLGLKNDERIPLLEDWPKWINLLKAGVELHFVDKVLVRYRVSETSLSTTQNKSKSYLDSCYKVYIYYQFPYIYRHVDKKEAILNYLRCKKIVSSNKLFWKIILKAYKLLFIHGNRKSSK